MKRHRLPSSSEDSDDNGSLSTWSQHSRSQRRRTSCSRDEDRKPSEVFRTDLITAMKLHDSFQLNPEEYYVLADPWRQEWEKGVQVPVSPGTIPEPVARVVSETKAITFTRPRKFIVSSGAEPPELGYVDIRTLADSVCRYDLNDVDVAWLQLANEEFKEMGMLELDEYTMERVMEEFEQRCYDNMNHAIETEEGLGIEYDEDVVCDVCQSPDGEDGNEMVFCDKCNICVHQACYGILKVPEGSWLCRTCALGVRPKCLLCPKKGGAMKPTRSGTKWVHVSCALWIPEVSIGSPEKMEPITKVSHIPSSRWALVCSLCNEKVGASIQCSVKNCRTAFHVTCAFDRGLEMKTILAENDEVKFKSYCPKHSSTKKADAETLSESPAQENRNGIQDTSLPAHMDPFHSMDQNQEEAHRVSLRKQKLQQLEDEFYTFVESLEVAKVLRLPEEPVEFLYQYWKLKRKSNFNKPLITPKKDEEDNLAKREQDVLFRRLQLFTHLRQDLERVRNLTYMVTRREKIKRSVCKVQEQIFNSYTKQLEQERVSGVPSSFSVESTVLFNSPSLGPNAPKIEDLKWHSAFFRKQMGTSLAHSLKKPHKRDRVRDRSGNDSKSLLRQPSLREGGAAPGSFLNLDKPFAETQIVAAQQKNSVVLPEHRKRRDSRPQCEVTKAELKEKTSKHNHKPLRPTELSQRQLENKRAVNHSGGRSAAPGTRRDIVPKCNGGLVKVNTNQTVVKVPTTPTSPGKNWGGFRIPKKGERQQQGESLEEACRQNSSYPYLGVGRVTAKERTKSKLKPDSENDGYVPDAEMSDSEPEVAEKKCRQQRLSPSSSIGRRTDIIRRSILAT
ncbi:protein Jade-1 isoform X2 [Pyrgilauda ruficollis]|nr:protein Jade-1 isoform X2 [Pyrgilauda ruficollis]XP_041338243.1 protein Jade-1 isoform X2 [Pyrgilauda ruficollis]XP_041338244.1 protein Jade-1 isoform X2 [Pyrgilauda ruficollis]XP_041338245.1 protein Jade-1 isoform X2 [Pyrgilauda ruficollis]XP_041338246.1 protein Jade-1 isoform X2 [Pyrgilauda ruficollis]XP_041338247.1 protein Jade-1 isoform X2 [Pyrgilauda ruficollis]XP_041338250.1 protein Jade-1 isoform X2 [Pyrgilauda ruficollis]